MFRSWIYKCLWICRSPHYLSVWAFSNAINRNSINTKTLVTLKLFYVYDMHGDHCILSIGILMDLNSISTSSCSCAFIHGSEGHAIIEALELVYLSHFWLLWWIHFNIGFLNHLFLYLLFLCYKIQNDILVFWAIRFWLSNGNGAHFFFEENMTFAKKIVKETSAKNLLVEKKINYLFGLKIVSVLKNMKHSLYLSIMSAI